MATLMTRYFKSLYFRAHDTSYRFAVSEIAAALHAGGRCLDCGAHKGEVYEAITQHIPLPPERYLGLDWSAENVKAAATKGLHVIRGDLNANLPYREGQFRCVFALSVLEHLLYGCHFIREAYRVLEPGGCLVLLTPNVSTLFNIFLLVLGKMPSSGPYPDSAALMQEQWPIKIIDFEADVESDVPMYRHLVVFSYRVLPRFLHMTGFPTVRGRAFGLYPFPNLVQPLLEKLDPYHCHQMVFVAQK
ncbi:MAG: methyltransferase domain-containing protein [Anaerolineae bacterium]|nr:methyltransferase domain-containing protein [Anaerolineae bacterium]